MNSFELLTILKFLSELTKEEIMDIVRSNKIEDKMENTEEGKEPSQNNRAYVENEMSKVWFKSNYHINFSYVCIIGRMSNFW